MNTRRFALVLTAAACWAAMSGRASALIITSPVRPGDVFGASATGTSLLQFRPGSVVSNVATTRLGGVTTDAAGNLWFSQGDGSTQPFQIETIPFAQTTSTVKISGATLNAPAGALSVRDIIFDSSGSLYAMFEVAAGNNPVLKYAPDGSGGFLTGTTVGNFGENFTDYGAGRLTFSADQLFLVSGNWTTKKLHAMRVIDGMIASANPGANTAGGSQIIAAAPGFILYSSDFGVQGTTFDPMTGAIGTASQQLLAPTVFVDGMTYSLAAGRLYFSDRGSGGEIRFATNAQLAAAAIGPPIGVSSLGQFVQNGAASILRDLAVIAPPLYPAAPQQGDLWVVDTNLRSVHQIRGSQKISTFTVNGDDTIAGVASDAGANLYIAGTGTGVYRIARGQQQVEWLLKPDEVAGSGLTVRDVAAAADGTLYVTYLGGNGQVDKFTPGPAGYTRTLLGQTGITNGDRGNLHSWLTANGKYLITSGRSDNRIVAMDTATGAITTWTASGYNLVGEVAIDPLNSDYVLFGTDAGSTYRLYGLSFDPATGAFGASVTPLDTDTDDWVDGMAFDPLTGDLYMSLRSNTLVKATYAQYLAARSGIPFDIDLLPRPFLGAEVNIARDMVVTNRVPEPSALALLALGSAGLGLCAWRRRRAGPPR